MVKKRTCFGTIKDVATVVLIMLGCYLLVFGVIVLGVFILGMPLAAIKITARKLF